MRKRLIIALLLAAALISSLTVGYIVYCRYQELKARRLMLEKRKACWENLARDITNETSRFKGKAGIIIKDLEMNWQIELKKDKLFPSASLAKIPIMASCFYAVLKGKIKLDDTLALKQNDKVSGSGTLKDMPAGSILRVENLIERMISESDNTAANMLISLLGFDYLNSCFKEFGLMNTNLARKMMDFRLRKDGMGNYTTAKDCAFLLEKIYRGELINFAVSKRCLDLLKRQKVNDRIPAKLPLGIAAAHKTGLERFVCHDTGIIFAARGNFLICVLTKHTDKNSRRAKDFIADIALAVYNYSEQF